MKEKRATEAEIISKHLEGLTILEIVDYFGYKSPSHVGDVLRRNGYKYNRHYKNENSIRRLRAEGLGYQEIARRIGNNYKYVSRVCRLLGLGVTAEERKEIQSKAAQKQHSVDWDAKVKKKTDGAFCFVSRQINENGESTIFIKCAICGNIRKTSSVALRHSEQLLPCQVCAKSEKERQKADKEYERQQKILRDFINKPRVQVAMPFCKCGELLRKNERVCKECKRQTVRSFEKRHELQRHNRIKNFGQIDKDITLARLYKRDAGVCYICGRSCDWNDHERNENGAFIVGPTYPTIDHVKPLSKGGGHVWQNVRLACFTCNILKSDNEIAAV